MDSFIFMFLIVMVISTILSVVTRHPEFFGFLLLFYFIRRLMVPRRRISRTYYYTRDNSNDYDNRNYENRNSEQRDNRSNDNSQTNSQNNSRTYQQQRAENLEHNARVEVRPPMQGSIDVEYTEEVEEDLPE